MELIRILHQQSGCVLIATGNVGIGGTPGSGGGTIGGGTANLQVSGDGYFTETDPRFPQIANCTKVTAKHIAKWNTPGSAPVSSVNGKTGAVVLAHGDVGAAPTSHTHSQYLTSFTESDPTVPAHVKSISTADIAKWNTPAAAGGAVDSVNGKTGVVVLSHTDVGAAAASHTHAYAPTNHTHSEYAPVSHTHSNYLTTVAAGNGTKLTGTNKIEMSGSFTGNHSVSGKSTSGEFHAKPAASGGTGRHFYAENDMDVSAGGSTGREIKIDFLTGKAERLYFQDWACVLKLAGSLTTPEMHSAVHATCAWNSSSLTANPKGNVKSLSKLGVGNVRGTYNAGANPYVGASPVPTSATNMGGSNAYGFCGASANGSLTTFEAIRKSSSGAAVEASGNTVVGMPINETARQTRTAKTDMEFEQRKAEHIDKLMHRAANTEWYDADSEGYANSPLSWAVPNVKTGGVLLTRSLVADQDSQEFYPDHRLINFADWPTEDSLFDAWELNGKRLTVNPDKARRQVLETLKYQARFYLPRVQCLQGIFDDDDELQELKDLILSFKSRAEVKTVTTLELNEVMRLIRQDIDEDYAFRKF